MRSFIIILLSILWFASPSEINAQSSTCDISTGGISSMPSIIPGSGTATISFQVGNDAGGSSCEYPVNSVMVIVTLPATGLNFQSFVTPAMGPFFNWSYNMVENVIVGVNHTAIADADFETFSATLIATPVVSNTYPECRTIVLDIINNPDGPIYPSNTSDSNDGGLTNITITPTNLSSTVNCITNAVQPVPTFNVAGSCTGPVITVTDSPPTLTCEGTRVYSFQYNNCGGCPFSSFTWTYTYIIDRTVFPNENGGPVSSSSIVNCASLAVAPTTFPVINSSCGEVLTHGGPILKSQFDKDFSATVLIAPAAAADTWYPDRFAPFAFTNSVFMGDNRLRHSIDASACDGCRGGFNGAFYNTQGRKYDLGAGANFAEIDLYVPSDWATTNKRMAGFWATAFNAANTVSAFPIIEFTSDGNNPRFRIWPNAAGNDFVNIGLPSGFVYNSWVNLQIRLLPSGEILFKVGDLTYQTTYLAANASTYLGNVILQGHNTASPGVTYDIYWDNMSWRENYVAPSCNGIVTYTYDYTDCAGLVYPWTYTYTVNRTIHPAEDGGPVASAALVTCADLAIEPTVLPDVLASCGEGPLSPGTAIKKSQILEDFTDPVTLSGTQAAGVWYTDRYAPAGFANNNDLGGNHIKHSINAADCESCRPPGFTTSFYNTQGRKYDLGPGTNYVEIDLYVPAGWQTTGRRMAGFWGTAYDNADAVSGFPIIEYTSEGGTPRFRIWPAAAAGGWKDLGLPSGFTHDQWITLQMRVLPSGEFLFTVGDLNYQTSYMAPDASVRIGNVILQGHNTVAPGVTYDIYWDNLLWRETFVAPECTGEITYTFDYTDPCNNLVFPWTFTYDVNDDVDPTWTTIAGALNATVQCSDVAGLAAAQALFPVASDNCDPDVTNIVKVPGVFVAGMTCSQAGTYTNTWTVTDRCGNISDTYTQIITIIDNTNPTWTTAAGALNVTIQCSDVAGLAAAQALVPVAMDNCDNDVLNVVKNVGPFVPGMSCPQAGTYTNTWTVTDDCGNVSDIYTQVITLIDNTAPVWSSLPGALDMTIECSDVAGLAAAQALVPVAMDNCDNSVLNVVKVSGAFVPGMTCPQAGSYTNTWTVTDDCGNVSAMYTQIITITDTELPVITLLGDATTYICFGGTYVDAGATASDNCSGVLTGSIVTVNTVNTSIAGTYSVTYNVTDNCGNAAIQATRTVIVRPHPTGTISGTATVLQNAPTTPVITFTGSNGTAPYVFEYSIQYNANPPTFHTTGPPGNPVTVAQSNAVVGVFTYTLIRVTDANGCQYTLPDPKPTAVITVISSCDLSTTIPRPINGSFVTAETKQGVVQFVNAGPGPTSGQLTFRISNIANFSITVPPLSGTYGGLLCQNSDFTVVVGAFFTTVTTTAVIPPGGNLRLGFIATATGSGGANGNLTSTIINGTGGDNNDNNNKSVRTFVIN